MDLSVRDSCMFSSGAQWTGSTINIKSLMLPLVKNWKDILLATRTFKSTTKTQPAPYPGLQSWMFQLRQGGLQGLDPSGGH